VPICGDKSVVEPPDAAAITANDCRLYLDRWRDHAAGTRYHSWAVLSGFFKFLYRAEVIPGNPMEGSSRRSGSRPRSSTWSR
jgi:hypothetical protein